MDAASSAAMIFTLAKDDDNKNKVAINFIESGSSANRIRLNCRGNNTNTLLDYAITKSALISTEWLHFVATWDRTAPKMQIFIDGALEATSTASMTAWDLDSTANKIFLSKSSTGDHTYWDGHFSNCSMYNRELTAADVSVLYNGGKPSDIREGVPVDGLVRWYPLDEEAGGTTDCFRDLVNGTDPGSAVNGAVTGVKDTP